MEEVVAHAFAGATAVAGDPVADTFEPGQLLDVEMQEFAGSLALVTAHRLLRLDRREASQPHPCQPAGNGGTRQTELLRDLLTGQPILSTQAFGGGLPEAGCLVSRRSRAGGSVVEPG
jgi:hypothetical protein